MEYSHDYSTSSRRKLQLKREPPGETSLVDEEDAIRTCYGGNNGCMETNENKVKQTMMAMEG